MDRRDDAALAGWAFKQGSKVKNWKKRFFVLQGRALAYYAAPPSLSKAEDDKEKGRVVVVGAELDAANAMLLVTCERKTQLLKLKPLVPEDAPLWLAALERAVGKSVPSSAVRHAGPAVIMSRQASGDGDYNLFGTNLHDEWDGDYRGLHDATPSESVADYYKAAQPMPMQAPPPPPPVDETSARLKMVASTLAMDIDNQTFHDDRSGNDTSFDFGESDDDSMLSRRSIDNRAALARGNHIGVAREGWLAINDGGWKTRYAVLAGPTLTYFASKGAADTDALASVWVTSVSLSSLRTNALDLLLDSGRVLGISADSREELIRWERAFASVLGTSVLLQSASSKDETLDEIERDVGVPTGAARRPSSYTGVFREGWLLVKQGFGKHEWQRRYFVLNGATLQERESPTATPLSEGFVVNLTVRNDTSMAEFELELMSGRSLRLQAANTVDAEAWIQALSDLVGTPAVKSMDPQQPTAHLATPVIRPPVNISSPRPQKISKKGWLMKEGGLIKSWKRRYFILDGDALHYFDKDRNGGLLGGGIVFRVVHSSAAANSLDIHFVNGRLLRVSTETRTEIDAWYDALRAAAEFSVNRVQRSSEAAPESSGLDDCQRGWLFKRGQRMKTWKKRYFFIQRNRLMYYNTIGGELLGSGTVFDVTDGNQRPLSLDVRFQNGRLLHIAAADDEDYKQWREALKSASNISESVLSQQNSFSQEETPFGKDFDFDIQDGNEAEGDDGDDLFDDYADDGELSAGYGTWEAAMNGLSRENSWDSDLSDDDSMSDSGRVSTPREMQRRESDTASVPEEPRGCSGWLRKEGKRVKNWKRRYFTLQGTAIKYFKSASGSLLRALEVTQVEEYPAVKFGFVIVTTEGRRLVVAAESNDEYEKWLLALWGVIADQRASLAGGNGGPGEDTRYSAVGAINVRGVPTSPIGSGAAATPFAKSDVSHSGWLEKEGQVFKTWKRRYFTVKNGALMYFSDIGGETQGHGTVHGVIIDKTKPNTLRILLAKDRVLRVTAATPAEMNTWFEVLLATQKPAPASRSPRGSTYGSEAGDEYSEMASSVGSAAGHRSVGGSAPSSPVAARTAPTRSRFEESDYLKNDTITNESFLRIRGPGDELSQTTGSFYKPRPFKGDLAFETKLPTPSETTAETDESTQLTRIDSEEDLEYLRGSSVDHARAEAMRRQREKEQELLPQKCTACCIVM